jgi:hypothetical protein
MSRGESGGQSSIPPTARHNSNSRGNYSKPKIHEEEDGEVVVELTVETDDNYRRLNSVDGLSALSDNGREFDDTTYAETEVDLMLHQSILDLKLQEKSPASLSPVVEDRLLRNIFHKYTLETTGLLSLSRYAPDH